MLCEHIQTIRIWAHVTVHLIGYLKFADVQRLWLALSCRPAGRRFPTLVGALPSILCERRFKGCGLQQTVRNVNAVNPALHMLVSARCQRGTKQTPPGSCATVSWAPRQSLKRRRNGGGAPRNYRVAEWVARGHIELPSLAQRRSADFRLQDTPPRFEVRAREPKTPIWAQSVSRYHQNGGDRPRCILPFRLLDTFLDVDRSLVELVAYTQSTNSHFDSYMGTKGCNDRTRVLIESASTAWDWEHLLFNEAARDHVQAFSRILSAFRDVLSQMDRPRAMNSLTCRGPGQVRTWSVPNISSCSDDSAVKSAKRNVSPAPHGWSFGAFGSQQSPTPCLRATRNNCV